MSMVGWVGMLGFALLTASCGGEADDGKKSCGSAAGCGGDLVGSWKVTSSCVQLDTSEVMGSMGCPGVVVSSTMLEVSGTVSYAAGGTYQTAITLNGSFTLDVPASCLTQQGITLTCGQLQQGLQGNVTGVSSVSCSGSSGCSCVAQLSPRSQASNGTYTTSGSTVSHAPNDSTGDSSTYCVNGNTLTEWTESEGNTNSITLTRQ